MPAGAACWLIQIGFVLVGYNFLIGLLTWMFPCDKVFCAMGKPKSDALRYQEVLYGEGKQDKYYSGLHRLQAKKLYDR